MRTQSKFMRFTAASALIIALAGLPANAGPRTYADVRAKSTHHATKIVSPGQSAHSKSIVIPFGKSTIIDLPGGMLDVIVSNPDIVDAVVHTAQRVLMVGKQPGQTNAFFYGHDGSEILNLEIRVERDLAGLRSLIKQHAPGNDVVVQAFNNNILLTGSVADAGTAKIVLDLANLWLAEQAGAGGGTLTNLMTIKGNDQVQLKVRIVEMQRSVTKQMGINFNALGQLGDANLGLIANSAVSTGAGFSGDLSWTNAGGGFLRSLSSQIAALERVGLVRTLAEPVLTSISGETANFQSGGEFPVLTNVFIDDNGQVQREFEYKSFGVSLGFTPVVISENRISLNISTEVSEPTTEGSFETGGSDILAVRVRKANSVIEVPAGGSMVIAGLIREEARLQTDGTPGIKDAPGIGKFFRSRDEQVTETELVIIVTPYLVKPTHPDKLQTPLDKFVPENDKEAAFFGRINKVYGKKGYTPPPRKLTGTFGHVVD